MPIEKIDFSQKQSKLFEEKLSNKLNTGNKLYKLREIIDREGLESEALSGVEVKQFGRSKKDHRVMLALLLLQAMYNGSDAFTEEELKENIYRQYFCGYEYLRQDIKVSEATIRRLRNALGEKGMRLF